MSDPLNAGRDTDAPLKIGVPDVDDVHPEAVDILRVFYGVTVTLEMLKQSLREGNPPEDFSQETVDTLEAAFRTGEQLLDHDAYEAFREEGLAALPEDLVADIRETMAPVASVYGVELELPGDTSDRSLADHLPVDVDWRGA